MTQEKQQSKTGLMGSKYLKMLLILIMALLLFGGPYILYILYECSEGAFPDFGGHRVWIRPVRADLDVVSD